MSGYVDFAALKERVSIEAAILLLGLELKQRNGQWRGPCPTCKSGGDRALVVTPAKNAFYCFGGRTGGDVIAFAAHVRDCGMKEAAAFLAGECGDESASRSQNTVPEERPKEDVRSFQPLTYLQPDHDAVKTLGLEPETCVEFGAGYAPKGIMRGRLAIPVHDLHGTLMAYCGHTVKRESPTLIFPNGFRPEEYVFNAHRIGEGETVLVRDPLEVMLAFQNGVDNTLSFLTETCSAVQLQMLAAVLDETGCEAVEIH